MRADWKPDFTNCPSPPLFMIFKLKVVLAKTEEMLHSGIVFVNYRQIIPKMSIRIHSIF